MDYSLAFARHFSRLVWLLMHQPDDIDQQKSALRALVTVSQSGPVRLSVQEGVLAVNGDAVPDALRGVDELLSQFAGHCVHEVVIDVAAFPADLLGTARVLATFPVEGDQGKDIDAKLRALAPRSVRVFFERSAATANPDVVRQFTTIDAMPEGQGDLFVRLDATQSVAAASRLLDLVVDMVETANRNNQPAVIAETMAELVRRESEMTDPDMRRAYAAAVRRLIKPTLLGAVASVLPRQKARADEILSVLARTGEEGAEALIEQLTAAAVVSDRRVFFDALVRLNAGVPTLTHMLGDPRWYVVRNAADLLGELDARESESALADLLKHDNDRVRRAAATALGKIGGADGARALREVLDVETDLEVQIAILGALGRIATPEAIQRLRKAAEPEGRFFKRKPAAFRNAAMQALAAARAIANPSSNTSTNT